MAKFAKGDFVYHILNKMHKLYISSVGDNCDENGTIDQRYTVTGEKEGETFNVPEQNLRGWGEPMQPSQHEPGAKLDTGKPRVALVLQGFNKALLRVAEVGTAGAIKYSDNGWKSVENGYARYSDAMLRHWLQEPDEDMDAELQIQHQAMVAWNALARLQLLLDATPEPVDPELYAPALFKRQSDE